MENLQKEFVPYKLALKLQELGFKESCFGMYCEGKFYELYPYCADHHPKDIYREVDAPTFSQAFRWFREKYGWVAEIHGSLQINRFYANLLLQAKGEVNNIKMCDTYEEAELACLDKLIEIVESKSK